MRYGSEKRSSTYFAENIFSQKDETKLMWCSDGNAGIRFELSRRNENISHYSASMRKIYRYSQFFIFSRIKRSLCLSANGLFAYNEELQCLKIAYFIISYLSFKKWDTNYYRPCNKILSFEMFPRYFLSQMQAGSLFFCMAVIHNLLLWDTYATNTKELHILYICKKC